MNIMKQIITGVFCLIALGAGKVAAEEQKPQEQKAYIGSQAFERMKQLVGTWEGVMDKGQGPMKTTASYKLTAGGSAVVETLFEGAPHEMVTVYYDSAEKKLNMTHYCMLRNRPKMVVQIMKPGTLMFDLAKSSEINTATDDHMHSLAINFEGKDKIVQHWTRFDGGKKKEVVDLVFNRVK